MSYNLKSIALSFVVAASTLASGIAFAGGAGHNDPLISDQKFFQGSTTLKTDGTISPSTVKVSVSVSRVKRESEYFDNLRPYFSAGVSVGVVGLDTSNAPALQYAPAVLTATFSDGNIRTVNGFAFGTGYEFFTGYLDSSIAELVSLKFAALGGETTIAIPAP